MQRFTRDLGDSSPRRVRSLLERPPAVTETGWADAALDHFAADPGLEWVAVLDYESQPVALAGRPLMPGGEPRLAGIDRLEPDMTLSDGARLAMRRPVNERLVPFLRCDTRGRFVGIIRIERVIAELAFGYDLRDRREPNAGVEDRC